MYKTGKRLENKLLFDKYNARNRIAEVLDSRQYDLMPEEYQAVGRRK